LCLNGDSIRVRKPELEVKKQGEGLANRGRKEKEEEERASPGQTHFS